VATYSLVADLLTGNIPTPAGLDPQKFVQDAADEIDSKIGFAYETPVNTNTAPRPVVLLLKRINNFLATGRLILAVATPGEDTTLNAYGKRLIDEATAALDSIVSGDLILPDIPPLDPTSPPYAGPIIINKDPESNVEAFYDRIANPNYIYWEYFPVDDGRLVY